MCLRSFRQIYESLESMLHILLPPTKFRIMQRPLSCCASINSFILAEDEDEDEEDSELFGIV